MTIEYRIHTATYRVERSFTGAKQASELIRERVVKAADVRSAGRLFRIPENQAGKNEKVV